MADSKPTTPLTPSSDVPPTTLRLEGPRVLLRPFEDADAVELYAASHPADAEARELHWRYMPAGPFADVAALRKLYHDANASRSPAHVLCLVVVDKPSGKLAGVVHFMNVVPTNRSLELGGIWYADAFKRTYVNTEAIFLLLRYTFETLGYRRCEWKCDSLNVRSHAAAVRLGFTHEGVFRQHMIIKGRNRDTAWLSITDGEWRDRVQASLEAKLAA